MTLFRRGRSAGLAFGLLLLALPAAASAHGLTGDATDKSTLEYVPLGIEHMLLGWDHLLFVLGIVLFARGPMRAAKLISLFVAGHSLTLIVATLAEWRVSATLVDVVIALSVVFVAVLGLRRDRIKDDLLPGAAFLGFGLIHGLGLSTRLQDLGIPDDGLLGKTIAFNVGIEIGQLVAVLVMFGVVFVAAQRVQRWTEVRRGVFAALGVAGLLAAVVVAAQGEDPEPAGVAAPIASAPAKAQCTTVEETPAPGGLAGGHPEKKFFGPDEQVPEEDLAHVIGDGWVIVRYAATATPAQVTELQQWIEGSQDAVAAAPDLDQSEGLTATTARRKASCQTYDFLAIQAFTNTWLEDLRAGRIQ